MSPPSWYEINDASILGKSIRFNAGRNLLHEREKGLCRQDWSDRFRPRSRSFEEISPRTSERRLSLRNYTQAIDAGVMSTIVGDQRYIEEKSSRSDPCVCRCNGSSSPPSAVHCFGPSTAHLIVRVKD